MQHSVRPVVQGSINVIDITETQDLHPVWCCPAQCFVTDQGVVVHRQVPTRWEDGGAKVRCESRLLYPTDDEHAYVELSLEDLRLKWVQYYGILPVEVARRLRDQLTEHLDAVE